MTRSNHLAMAERIGRCRLIFSVLVLGAVVLDPAQPALNPWVALLGVAPPHDRDLLGTTLAHLAYSVCAYVLARSGMVPAKRLAVATSTIDVLFGAAIGFLVEGRSSLFYPFFTFAIVAAAVLEGMRRTMQVTVASVGLWLALMLLATPAGRQLHIMQPVYLLVVGYFVGFLGQQRLNLESEVRELAAAEQRTRIARDIHDGFAQVLSAVNLQLESCRELLRGGRSGDALAEVTELQRSVNAEHDELRAYVRALAGRDAPGRGMAARLDTQFTVDLQFEASGALVHQVLSIVREGVSNVVRHANAARAVITARVGGSSVHIRLDDDGAGFRDEAERPWSIARSVHELGGGLKIPRDAGPGAHLEITLPRS